ncbi:MAG: Fe-Mn family superoxide dismutase [Rhodospirillales bacterium]|nr:Fe-Mn family superoxide dismutase [Rhodospirillales bacterium]
MRYAIKPLPFTPSKLSGLSEKLLASHYENNYGGAIRRLNAIRGELARLDPAAAPIYAWNGLKLEELIAANSAVLHEIYFDSLGPAADPPADLAAAIARDFGGFAAWRDEFMAMGRALGGGSGWVVLAWSAREERFVNQRASDHTQFLAEGRPILALDMYEHAYHMDYGARTPAYVEAFMRNIDWTKVAQRWRAPAGRAAGVASPKIPVIAPEAFLERFATADGAIILDVRRPPAFTAGADMLRGAVWRNPERLMHYKGRLRPNPQKRKEPEP